MELGFITIGIIGPFIFMPMERSFKLDAIRNRIRFIIGILLIRREIQRFIMRMEEKRNIWLILRKLNIIQIILLLLLIKMIHIGLKLLIQEGRFRLIIFLF